MGFVEHHSRAVKQCQTYDQSLGEQAEARQAVGERREKSLQRGDRTSPRGYDTPNEVGTAESQS